MILYIPHSRILCSTPNVTFQLLALKSLKLLPSFQILQPLATYILGNLKRLPSTSTALPPGLLFSGFFRQTRVVAIVREMFISSLYIFKCYCQHPTQTFESLSLANSERSSSVSLIWRGDSLRANIKPSKALPLSVLKLVTLVNNATAASWQTLQADSSPPDNEKMPPPTLVT